MNEGNFPAFLIGIIFCIALFVGGGIAGQQQATKQCMDYYKDKPYSEVQTLCEKIVKGEK